ncbi:MAG: ABC transporter ATP-binding protein [Pyrinomonadaceae bacterium]
MIRAENISFSYGAGPVLDGLSLELRPGEFVGLIGANGSGKTTLMRILLGFLRPGSGTVFLKGDPVLGLARREIAKRATLVQQDTYIDFAFTVREVVAMGRTPYLGRFTPEGPVDASIIDRAMAETETDRFAARPVTELSGGERQRVHLARAMAQDTEIILLDEPTANLDLTHQIEALEMIRSMTQQGKTAFAAIHDLGLASRYCDRLVLLSGGRIAADGPPASVITEENLLRHFNLKARVSREAEGLHIFPVGPGRANL